MSLRSPIVYLCASLFLVGCSDQLAPDTTTPLVPTAAVKAPKQGELGVMSYNLYVGADLDQVIGALVNADPADDFPALLNAIDVLGQTDYPSRVEAIADAIAAARPDVVGLQEVWTIAIDLRPYGVPVAIDLDFQALLQDALAARGLNYAAAASVQNTDAGPFPGIRVVDHDVILVDQDRVTVTGATGRNFAANIGPVAPGIVLLRGYVTIEATIAGRSYTFVNAHLESGKSAAITGLRALQATELVSVIGSAPTVVLMGDLNDVPGSPMHQVLTAGGLVDAWSALRPGARGLTCCHAPDLSNAQSTFDQRIDYVFGRGLDQAGRQLKGQIEILGDQAKDRIDGPFHAIWPSDHAGLTVTLSAP